MTTRLLPLLLLLPPFAQAPDAPPPPPPRAARPLHLHYPPPPQPPPFHTPVNVEGEKSAYSGYFYLPETKTWKHLVTFRTKTGGDKLKGLYSFVEDFKRDTASATQTRRAAFGNAWIHDTDWKPLTTARFTA